MSNPSSLLPAAHAIAITGSAAPARPGANPKTPAFDPWNSSSTGHQRSEGNPGAGTGWRASRNRKLRAQFLGGNSGVEERISDSVGRGSEDFDEGLGMVVPRGVRCRAGVGVRGMLLRQGAMRGTLGGEGEGGAEGDGKGQEGREETRDGDGAVSAEEKIAERRRLEDEEAEKARGEKRGMFDGLVVYVNGSTHPLISDHKLKQVLSKNGARMSLHLGRRQVTHVILGRPSAVGKGAGGGLAGGKLEKEIRRVGGCGIKFVGVEWVLESIKAGKRLPEARFTNLKIAPQGQKSVYGMFGKTA